MGGKKEFLLVNQHDMTAWLGCGARMLCWGQNRWTFVSTDPTGSLWGVRGTQPYKVGTYNQLCSWDFHIQDPLLLFLPPELSQGQHTVPMSPPRRLVPCGGTVLMGQDTEKPTPHTSLLPLTQMEAAC